MSTPRLSVTDLSRLRFVRSPLVEVVESLWMLASGRIRVPYQDWHARVRGRLGSVDMALLGAVIPGNPTIADFFFTQPGTDIAEQLRGVADCPPERVAAELAGVWDGLAPPPVLRSVTPRRLADELHRYWTVAIEPDWRRIGDVLDSDIAYRTNRFVTGGIEAVFADLHPSLSDRDPATGADGPGLRLVPSVFTWPYLLVVPGHDEPPSIVYGARDIDTLWGGGTGQEDDEAVASLLGRTRAAILSRLALPMTTTELAGELGQTAPSVSHHLTVLRQNGLVTARRSGRRVLYQRTPLGTSVLVAGGGS